MSFENNYFIYVAMVLCAVCVCVSVPSVVRPAYSILQVDFHPALAPVKTPIISSDVRLRCANTEANERRQTIDADISYMREEFPLKIHTIFTLSKWTVLLLHVPRIQIQIEKEVKSQRIHKQKTLSLVKMYAPHECESKCGRH